VKRIFQKNQIMITALALMLAVAGYFSFMNKDISDPNIVAEANVNLLQEEYEISDEDMFTVEDIFVAEELIEWDTQVASGEMAGETASDVANMGSTEAVMNPGETVFTGATIANIDYASEMKLSREQIRSKNKETLLEIINNTGISKPVNSSYIIAVTCTSPYFGNLKFLVVFSKKNRNLTVYIKDSALIQPLCILGNILFIIKKQLLLQLQCSTVILLFYKHKNHSRHTAQNHILPEVIQHYIIFNR